jgi:hypothetical protein
LPDFQDSNPYRNSCGSKAVIMSFYSLFECLKPLEVLFRIENEFNFLWHILYANIVIESVCHVSIDEDPSFHFIFSCRKSNNQLFTTIECNVSRVVLYNLLTRPLVGLVHLSQILTYCIVEVGKSK